LLLSNSFVNQTLPFYRHVHHRIGVDPLFTAAHISLGMATVLHRFLRLCLALALMVGVTGQLMPHGMAAPQVIMSADTAGGCAGPQPPCTGHMPNCLDHGGCITVSALPALPTSIAVPVEWASLDYDLAPESLAGISVKPELSPPILTA
jgi:hypothetical protein